MKKVCLYLFLTLCLILIMGCEMGERKPLTVTFMDVSGALSTDHTIKISFAEEKDYEEYYVDILVRCDTDDVELTLFQEFAKDEDKIKINIGTNSGFVSLDEYKIFNMEEEQTDSMVGYVDALTTNLVVNSSKDATLTLLAVVGEKENGKFKQVAEVSKEYTLNVKKHIK